MHVELADGDREAELGAERLGEAGDGGGGAGEDRARLDAQPAPCAWWKSSELRTSAAMRRTPSTRTARASATMSVVALDVLERRVEADVLEPGAGVLERERRRSASSTASGLEAAAGRRG